jgi:hypothetical protein
VTDSQDPFFYFSLCLTEEDFQHLKSSQGLLGKLKGLGHELELKYFNKNGYSVLSRVSFETSFFDSKQPKLEPKLVSALSETKRLFRLFRFYTGTESFDVSIEPKQTEDQPKLFDREHILQKI